MKPRTHKIAKLLPSASAGALLVFSLASANAQTDRIVFTQKFQPDATVVELNINPFAGGNAKITARSRIDETVPFAYSALADSDPAGITSNDVTKKGGIGAQFFENGKFSGSSGISGGGGHKDEELIFNFSNGVLGSSLVFTLTDLQLGKGLLDDDDPVIFVDAVGFTSPLMFNEPNGLLDAGVLTANNTTGFSDSFDINIGALNFGAINPASLAITEVRIRETNGHTYVNAFAAAPVPEPSSAALIALSVALPIFRRRRR